MLKVLRQTRKYSAYGFIAFAGIHFTNTGLIPVFSGVEEANSALDVGRFIYQSSPGVELSLVFGSAAVHVWSGIILNIVQRFRSKQRYVTSHTKRVSWQNLSGFALIPLMMLHSTTVRAIPQNDDHSQVSLDFVGYLLQKHPYTGYILYGSLVSLASYHFLSGLAYFTQCRFFKRRRALTASILVTAAVWVTSLVKIGRESIISAYAAEVFDKYYRRICSKF